MSRHTHTHTHPSADFLGCWSLCAQVPGLSQHALAPLREPDLELHTNTLKAYVTFLFLPDLSLTLSLLACLQFHAPPPSIRGVSVWRL